MSAACSVLISSAGRRVALIECFRESAAALGVDLRVIAADLNPEMSAACQVADEALEVPRCDRDAYIEALLEVCRRRAVALVVPTIDPELENLSRNAERFRAIGTFVSVSSPETVRLARDKLATARFLTSHELPAPRSARLDELMAASEDWSWPLIVKPRAGSSSIGIRTLASPDELRELAPSREDMAQELLRGQEYTVNMFFDRAGQLHAAIPHLRREVRAGEVAKGTTRHHAALEAIAWSLGDALPAAHGVLCFQAIVDPSGRTAVFELNARFGGGYPLTHRAGGQFTRWLLEEALGRPLSANNDWQAGITMLRYDSAVFRGASPG